MKKAVLRYGGLSALFITAVFIINFTVFAKVSYETQEILGWIGIILSTLFIYFGIKYYRDRQNNGMLSFGEGLKLGLLIVLLPSFAFGVFDVIYVMNNPDWMDAQFQKQVSKIRIKFPAAEAAAKIAKMEKDKELFGNPAFMFFLMFASVFLVGLIVTVISTLLLRRNGTRVQTA